MYRGAGFGAASRQFFLLSLLSSVSDAQTNILAEFTAGPRLHIKSEPTHIPLFPLCMSSALRGESLYMAMRGNTGGSTARP